MYDIPSLSLVYRLMADSPVLGRGETVKVREEVEDVSSTIILQGLLYFAEAVNNGNDV